MPASRPRRSAVDDLALTALDLLAAQIPEVRRRSHQRIAAFEGFLIGLVARPAIVGPFLGPVQRRSGSLGSPDAARGDTGPVRASRRLPASLFVRISVARSVAVRGPAGVVIVVVIVFIW